jgi:hypothetical protein
MERWLIVLFVVAIFSGLGFMGWRYRRTGQPNMAMCTSAEAHCGDRPYLGTP